MPWMLNKPPLAVQVEARKQALRKKHAGGADAFLYWMSMGTGKTGCVLNEFAEYLINKKANFLIVVTLNSFKQGWLDEAANFGLELKLSIWPECQKTDPRKLDGIVLNYEAIIGSGGDYIEKLLTSRKVYLAFDECHRIKGHGSAVTKRSMKLWKEAAARRGLTGTPMAQDIGDLFSQLKLGGALNGDNFYAFRNRYATMGGYLGKRISGVKPDQEANLRKLMDRHSFRATKAEWLDLPQQNWHPAIQVEMPPKIKKLYEEMRKEFIIRLGDVSITAEMIISQMLKLQQIGSGFVYGEDRQVHHLMKISEMPKYKAVADLASSLEGSSKLIVFAYYRATIDRLKLLVETEQGYKPAVFVGGMGSVEIAAEKAAFNSDEGPDILLAQLSVGSATHTLLGGKTKPCYTACYFENSYSLLDRMQSESRNHRTGQHWPVDYWDIVSSPTEAKVIKALQTKNDLVKAIVEGVKHAP